MALARGWRQWAGVKNRFHSPRTGVRSGAPLQTWAGVPVEELSSLERNTTGGWTGLESRGGSGKTGVHSKGVSVGEAGSTAYYSGGCRCGGILLLAYALSAGKWIPAPLLQFGFHGGQSGLELWLHRRRKLLCRLSLRRVWPSWVKHIVSFHFRFNQVLTQNYMIMTII